MRDAVLTFSVLGCLLLTGIGPAQAVGESYTLTASPARSQEETSEGVDLILGVSGATTSVTYAFTWTVTDPSGTFSTAVNSTLSTQTSWVLIVNYPSSFSGGTLRLVGTYTVNVSQTSPTPSPNVASGNFEIGLTDNTSYQRTFPVSIKAAGYLPSESVTIDISGTSAVQGFPTTKTADTNGHVTHSWTIPCALGTGIYSVTVTGAATVKTPPDSQPITIHPANVTISQLLTTKNSLQRTETIGISFGAGYNSGSPACGGSANLRLIEPNGVTSHYAQAAYNLTAAMFFANYRVPLSVQAGSWVATVEPGSFDDGFGNRGPVTSPQTGFTVQPASLNVSVTVSGRVHSAGETIVIGASVINPDGTSFNEGSVTAALSHSGKPVSGSIAMFYDQATSRWVGSYKVDASDPSGTWLVRVASSDAYGNSGEGSTTSLVGIPSTEPSLTTTFSWLIPTIVAAGLGVLIILLRNRQLHSEVKLDVQAIKTQAEKVQQDDFLHSIQDQLKRRTERMAKEKDHND